MTISGISSMPSPAAIAPVSTTQRAAVKTASPTDEASPSTTSSQASTAPASSTAASGKVASHGSGQSQSTESSAQENTLAAVYTTTVAGKSYSGSVVESDGEYEASVPNLPGASASGSSVESAENNLAVVIDALA